MKNHKILGCVFVAAVTSSGCQNGPIDAVTTTARSSSALTADAGSSTGATLPAVNNEMPSGISYASTTEVSASTRPAGLCELWKYFNAGAGLYRVDNIVGVTEDSSPGQADGFTYVQLTKLEDWSGTSPEHPVVRISGGPAAKAGVTKIWSVALSVGESIGALLLPATPENKNYLQLHSLGVFHLKNGGYTNGHIFSQTRSDLVTLRAAVKAATAPRGCSKDTLPEFPKPVDPPSADVQALKGPVIAGTADLPSAGPVGTVTSPATDLPSSRAQSH